LFEFEKLKNNKYILLETYKRNQQPVRTPVWFVLDKSIIYVITRDRTGKIKRLRNNSNLKICICTFNGKPIGDWVAGTAKFANEEETRIALQLRRKKYGFMEIIARFVSKSKGNLIVFSIMINKDE
jgi:PPOX class probable F420-dependent enzyme